MMSRVADGVLMLKNASDWKGICFGAEAPICGEVGDYYIFETDFVWLGGSQETADMGGGAAFIGFLGDNRSTDNTQMYGYGYMSFVKNDPDKINVYGALLDKGASYNLRFVYQVGGYMKLYVAFQYQRSRHVDAIRDCYPSSAVLVAGIYYTLNYGGIHR
jgi:hypothetical protein